LIRRPLLAAAIAALLAVTGCAKPATGTWSDKPRPSAGASAGAGAVAWEECGDVAERIVGSPLSGPTAECGVLRVPQDWANSSGQTLDISMLRLPATGSRRIGSLLVNPGGPGASGVDLAAYAALLFPPEIRQRFDIVGFDPRGVGRSTQVACVSDKAKDDLTAADYDPASQAEFDEAVRLSRDIGKACATKYGATLGLFNTEQTARDMDAIRQAVGDPKMTYLGYSYGTLIGAVYAQLFPAKVRALVLDGAVDPQQDDIAASESQAAGFEKAFDNFAADCKRRGRACPLGSDTRGSVNAILTAVRAKSVPGRGGEKRRATAGYAMLAIVAALYSQQQWPKLATSLDKLRDGDPTGVFELADSYNERDPDGRFSNQIDANLAVNCADEKTPPTVEKLRQLQSTWRAKYPLFGAALALSMLGCATWPAKRHPYPTGSAPGAPPIVVIGTTGDPATPYANAEKLARMLGTGVLLSWDGEGHTAYPQTKCIRDSVGAYLVDLRPPADGKRCPAR
jgi:pimeloyl-ACP methyl ester carboxylesterase